MSEVDVKLNFRSDLRETGEPGAYCLKKRAEASRKCSDAMFIFFTLVGNLVW